MQLHLKSKEIAWGGIMMALAVILVVLSGIIESSSLFLLAAASFITGMVQRRFSLVLSITFLAGTFLVGIFIAPQKLYCFTFAGFSVYVILAEYFRAKGVKNIISFIVKGLCYHILLVAAFVMVKYFVGFEMMFKNGFINKLSEVPVLFFAAAVAGAELLWIIFDRAYVYFQDRYGEWLIRAGE